MIRQTLFLIVCFAYLTVVAYGQSQNEYETLVLSHEDYSTYGLYSQSYDSSRSFYEDLISKCEKYGYWDLAIGALSYLAYTADLNHSYDDMEIALEKGRIILRERKNYLDSADPLYTVRSGFIMQIALYYSRVNKMDEAEQILLSLIEQLKEKPGTEKITFFNAYARMADLYGDMGLYEKAYPYYLLMEKAIPGGESHAYYRFLLRQYMSTYYIGIKDYHSARLTLLSALKDIKNRPAEGEWVEYFTTYYELMGTAYQGLNKFDSAINSIKMALLLQDRNSPTLTYTYENYGNCLAAFGKHHEAINYYLKVDSLYRQSKTFSSFRRAQNLSNLSEARLFLNDDMGALRSVQLALYSIYKDSAYLRNLARNPVYSSIQPDKVLIKLLIVKSGSLSQLSKTRPDNPEYLKASLETYKLAAQIIDKFRHEISTDDFKHFFVTDIRPMYEDAVNTCWRAWQNSKDDSLINLAIYFMEKSKYQVLLDAVNADYAETSGNIPESIIAGGNEYKARLVLLQNRITKLKLDDSDSLQMSRLQIDFAETRNKYENYLDMMEAKYPKYYNLRFNSKAPSIADLKEITGKSVIVEYMASDSFIAIVATDHRKNMFKLVRVNEEFYKNLDQLLGNLRQSPYSGGKNETEIYRSYVNNAYGLYELLFKAVREEFRSSYHFTIIPDGKLSYLPFDILLERYPDDNMNVNYRDLSYLMKSSVIHYEFSSSLMVQNSKIITKKGGMNYIGFSPVYPENSELRKVKVLGKESFVSLRPLKFSQIEVNAAASVFKGNTFTGENADAGRFKEKAALAGIIHFAGHTYINDSIPELSCLFFSKPSGMISDEYSKSVIYANEILNLNLNAFLVLLSTCESGTGKLLKGEGLFSIGRSFRYAGAQNIVMTMWKINDQSASLIINNFCKNIKRGKASDVSLRNAKLAFLQNANPKNTHPYYWAAFIFIGDDDPLMIKGFIYIIIAAVISLLTIILYLKSARGSNPMAWLSKSP